MTHAKPWRHAADAALALTAIVLVLASSAVPARPTAIVVEDAIEASSVEIVVGADGHGYALVRTCRECEAVKLAVVPETEAFEDGRATSLARIRRIAEPGAVVFFTPESRTVTRITW